MLMKVYTLNKDVNKPGARKSGLSGSYPESLENPDNPGKSPNSGGIKA
jgi:hypothetical protein